MGKFLKLFSFLLVTVGGIAGSLFLFKEDFINFITSINPPTYMYGLFGTCLILWSAFKFYTNGWEEAKPNEWLVIVQNGEQIKYGVGLICFRWFYQTAIKFPSAVQKVQFSAMQVCKEMQGLQIQGFAIWAVHRQEPFKFYKQMHGANANQSIRKICESVVRHQIANTDLSTVMTQREILRDNMKNDLQQILTGWGVWLETVEITEIKICSNSLFEDMQAPSKQENFLSSEKCKLKINNEMSINTEKSDLDIKKYKEEKETKRLEHYYVQQLKQIQQEAIFQKKQFELQKQKLLQKKELEIQEIKASFAYTKQAKEDEIKITQQKFDQEMKVLEDEIQAEQNMSELNMNKLRLEMQKELLSTVPLQEMNINSYCKPEDNTLESMVPTFSMIQNKEHN